MTRLVRFAAAAMLLASCGAHASLHSICYEGPTRGEYRGGQLWSETLTVVAGCQDDSGAPCSVEAIGADIPGSAQPVPMEDDAAGRTAARRVDVPAGTFRFFQFRRPTSALVPSRLRVVFRFANSPPRECSVEPRGWIAPNGLPNGATPWVGHPTGTLTGFSSDASGLVSTGVWRAQAPGNGVAWARVPAGFIAVGGGATAADGAFVERSQFSALHETYRGWEARSGTTAATVVVPPKGQTTAYVVGLRIEGVPTDLEPLVDDAKRMQPPGSDLRSLVRRDRADTVANSFGTVVPLVGVPLGSGRVALGGGVEAWVTTPMPSLDGLFVHESYPTGLVSWFGCILTVANQGACAPSQAMGWQVRAVAESGAHHGHIAAVLASLPDKIVVDGKVMEVRGRMVHAPSTVAMAPAAEVRGLRGEYAVVGAGAAVRGWPHPTYGDMAHTWLNRIEPRLDIGGAAASTGTLYGASLTSLGAWANGIKLVPAGSPPDLEMPPRYIERVFMCLSLPPLLGHEVCRAKNSWLEVAKICEQHPDLIEHGLCVRP